MSYDWEKLRKEEWPVLETMTFLDAACVSFAPQRTVRAVKEFADMTARQDEANSPRISASIRPSKTFPMRHFASPAN